MNIMRQAAQLHSAKWQIIVMLSVIMLYAALLSVVMMSVVAPQWQQLAMHSCHCFTKRLRGGIHNTSYYILILRLKQGFLN